jgi:hypothetical protein
MQRADRSILVFAIWASLGALGLCLFLEALARDSWALSVAALSALAAAFVAHVVVNALSGAAFTRGETVLGVGAYGALGLVFVAGAATGGLSAADLRTGLILFGVIAAGMLGDLVTRHGLRGDQASTYCCAFVNR